MTFSHLRLPHFIDEKCVTYHVYSRCGCERETVSTMSHRTSRSQATNVGTSCSFRADFEFSVRTGFDE